jgi:hypothetical protein
VVGELIETLTALGVTLTANGDRLRIEPASKVPPELVPRIREAKPAILEALLRSRPATSTKPDKPIECRYDWQRGYRGLRLHCVAHQHAAGTATVFRMVSFGRDVLLEMAELGILTGQALKDSRRRN